MARSHSIHILSDPMTRDIIGAFTVKHEMLTWVKAHGGFDGNFDLVTVRDGQPVLEEHTFTCPECKGHYFGSWTHKRNDGSWLILSQHCNDQFQVGCRGMILMPATDDNPVTPQDYIDANHPLRFLKK